MSTYKIEEIGGVRYVNIETQEQFDERFNRTEDSLEQEQKGLKRFEMEVTVIGYFTFKAIVEAEDREDAWQEVYFTPEYETAKADGFNVTDSSGSCKELEEAAA